MSKLDDVRALIRQGAVIEVIKTIDQRVFVNRCRIAKVGKSFFDYTAENASQLNPSSFGRIYLPIRIRDIISVDSDSCKYKIDIDNCTIRLRIIPGTAW